MTPEEASTPTSEYFGRDVGSYKYNDRLPPVIRKRCAAASTKAAGIAFELHTPVSGQAESSYLPGVYFNLSLATPDDRTSLCSCGTPLVTGMPCCHLIRLCAEGGQHDPLAFVDPVLRTSTARRAYAVAGPAVLPDHSWASRESRSDLQLPRWLLLRDQHANASRLAHHMDPGGSRTGPPSGLAVWQLMYDSKGAGSGRRRGGNAGRARANNNGAKQEERQGGGGDDSPDSVRGTAAAAT